MKPSQAERIRRLLADGQPHSTIEIMEKVYGGSHLGIARIGARIHDLKAKGCEIQGCRDTENAAVYWYSMKPPVPKVRPVPEFIVKDGVRMVRLVPEQ